MSEEAIIPDERLDVKGLACPMPIVKLAQTIKKMDIGQIVEVLATDPGTVPDIAAWSKQTGNEVLKHEKEGKVLKFYVKRRK
ncbi:MAG: sulfurtransferase TusA family protein [Promethearchaeota archaeon]